MVGLRQWYDNQRKMNRDCGGVSNRVLNLSDVAVHYVPIRWMLYNHQIKNLTINHAGIIIGLLDDSEKNLLTYTSGIDLLVNYFNKNEEAFDIYFCKTKEAAKDVIEKKEVNRIWIFGHGWMGGLYFGKFDDILEYSDFKSLNEEQKKDFVGQFHCCNRSDDLDSSLAAYILKTDGKKFIKKGYRCSHQNRLAIECCNKKKWDCNNSSHNPQ